MVAWPVAALSVALVPLALHLILAEQGPVMREIPR
jgi:hypothetical protein